MTVLTASGRSIPEPPRIRLSSDRVATADLRLSRLWLLEQAIAEADARFDEWNGDRYRREREDFVRERKRRYDLPPASVDDLNVYLFGWEDPSFDPRYCSQCDVDIVRDLHRSDCPALALISYRATLDTADGGS